MASDEPVLVEKNHLCCIFQAKAVTLDGLWIHLSPDDADLKGLQEAAQASALEAFRSHNNLNKDVSQVCCISMCCVKTSGSVPFKRQL